MVPVMHKTLVAGWFSWEMYSATAGDLMACEVACDWLRSAGHALDVALAPPFVGGVDWRTVNPGDYSHLVFVCGPFRNIGPAITDFLERFAHCRRIGLDLSMIEPVEAWNPFDLLLERDSNRAQRPDISFACRQGRVPVVGVCLVHPQKEYRDRGRHQPAKEAIERLLATREVAAVPIDTRLDANSTGLRTSREVESLIARMDLLLTTRLHGTVLAIKNGVPALAIDPIAGGAKIQRQAQTVGWPVVFTADALEDAELQRAFDYCLTAEARAKARECTERATSQVVQVRDEFIAALVQPAYEPEGG
jgi:hypothetical protein